MKSTILKSLAILLLLSLSSCEEEITTPTTVKLNVTDTKGRPIKDFRFSFEGSKRVSLLNFIPTFSIHSKTDTNGNCTMSIIIPKETIEIGIQVGGDSLYNYHDDVFISLDSLNFVSYFHNPQFVNTNYKKGQTTKFYYRVQR
ncbi:hypothetical protein [Flectobacillus roseus]|uniref:Big-1 domain-containing protein n=1 Tax=Flectobacillus roseus TaxID=502259 RepID=A0ABT6YG10_9BACT|nr:hypothetical protein [Flectobacillus roseus]MDI9862500.1 hypothetical protein [Flectobacillus roseus]